MGDGLAVLDCPLGEDVRLALQVAVVVQHLQGAQQVVGVVPAEGQAVAPAVDQPVARREAVVKGVQPPLVAVQGGVRLHLRRDQLLEAVPEPDHALDAGPCRGVELGADHDGVLAEPDLAVHDGVGKVLHGGVGGDGLAFGLLRLQLRNLGDPVLAVDAGDGPLQLLGQVCAGGGMHGVVVAVPGTLEAGTAQHHLRVVIEIDVDRVAVLVLHDAYPVGQLDGGFLPLLEKDDVRHDVRPGVGLEGVVGEPDGPQQIGALRQVLPHGGILAVHGVAAGDEGHDAAGAELVQGLGEEIVVDREAQLVVSGVADLVIAEGYIADGGVKEVLGVRAVLIAPHHDVGLGVELLGDAAGDGVQLHAVQPGRGHGLRQAAEEAAHAAGGLQDVAGLEAHAAQGLVDGPDDDRRREVGVQGAGPRRSVLVPGQQGLQLDVLVGPLGFVRREGVRDAAPAHVAGEDLLLVGGRGAPLGLDGLQNPDGGGVGGVLGLGASNAKIVVRDAEVNGRRGWPGGGLLPGLYGPRSGRCGLGVSRHGKLSRGLLGRLRGGGGRFRLGTGNRSGGGLSIARRRGILQGFPFLRLVRRGRRGDGPAGHARLDGALHLPQDDVGAIADGIAQGQDGDTGVELADTLEVLRGEIAVQVKAAAGQQQERQADGDGAAEAQGDVVLVQTVQGAAMDGQHDFILEIVPVFVRELHSQGDKLLGEAVAAGDAEGFLQPGRDRVLVLVPVLPEHGIPAVLPALRVGHVEHVAEEYPAVAVTQQGDSFRAAPDAAAHAMVPEVELRAGGGVRALGVNHDLVQEAIFVELPRHHQELGPVLDLGSQIPRGVVRHLAVGFDFRCHLRHSFPFKLYKYPWSRAKAAHRSFTRC